MKPAVYGLGMGRGSSRVIKISSLRHFPEAGGQRQGHSEHGNLA